MKLKQQHDDFRVEEFSSVEPGQVGAFAFYRLEKRGWTTPDALAAMRRRWEIDLKRVSSGGLKDRHAHTIQYLTIYQGPERDLNHGTCDFTYLGRLEHAYNSDFIRANGFTIVLRSLSPNELQKAQTAIPEIAVVGIPNYFDDQRFGSVNPDREFVAKEMVRGNFEKALQLALAAPYEHDRAEGKQEKAILNEYWGRWAECKSHLPRSHARSLVDYLIHHPTNFKGACERLRPELQGLYLSAWQSDLWNRILDRWLQERVPESERVMVKLKLGRFTMPRSLSPEHQAEWEDLYIPLPSARLKPQPDATWWQAVNDVMAEEGIPLAEMKIKGMDRPFFSKGDRSAKIAVANLQSEAAEDDVNRGRQKLKLSFELSRGSYATMLVKRLTTKVD
jgi:tRNA pseudouridine13 synthase